MTKAIDKEILERANHWLKGGFDDETKARIKYLMQNDPNELTDAFYRDLEFGTGGLRGVMGVGTNRMNKYTVGMATQGLANYLLKMFPEQDTISVAVAHDSRNNSRFFAEITAAVFSANGIHVYLFEDLRPTPVLSFAIRKFNCQSGVMVTASHNPKEYNGYKAYWDDGSQLIPPHDKNVINEVKMITDVAQVKFDKNPDLIKVIGEETDRDYLKQVKALSVKPDVIREQSDLKIVYTPLHGTGVYMVPKALELFGFENIIHVEEQDVTSGDFPTVESPNPEEPAALEMAINRAKETGADLVMASDPDADRVGIAVRDDKGEFVLLNGNQTATLMIYYLLKNLEDRGKLTGNEFIVKTVVTTELINEMASHFKVDCYDTLTGFKWIAEVIRKLEGKKRFIVGGEESYGLMIGDFVRDKDSVSSCCMIAEAAAWAASQDKTLYQLLPKIYHEFSFYRERLLSITRKGKSGAEEIQAMMDRNRENPPESINGSRVIRLLDYLASTDRDLDNETEAEIKLPKSNVLQLYLADGSKITMRPSGTEPKIKFYFSVNAKLDDQDEFSKLERLLDERIDAIIEDMDLQAGK